jgi:trans-2-enoyl-CoA reductase
MPTGLFIFRDIRWSGFWLTRWWEKAREAEREETLGELERLAQKGVLKAGVDSVFGLGDLGLALERAQQPGRSGKVLIGFGPTQDAGGQVDG